MEKPKVGIFTQRFSYPVNTFIHRQINGVRSDYETILLTSTKCIINGPSPEYQIFEKEKTSYGRLYRVYKKYTGSFSILSQKQIDFFKNILLENNIKLIHAHYGPSGIEIVPLAKEIKLPLIVSFHGYDASFLLEDEKYHRQLQEVFDYGNLIAVSKYMANKLISAGANPGKLSVIYYGVPVEDKFVIRKPVNEKIKNDEEITLLQISGFEEKKGHFYTLNAFRELLKHYQNCKLMLGGKGSLLNDIKNLCKELNLQDKVFFLGAIEPEEVFEVMKKADMFLHHSVTAKSGDKEGIPNVIMEAMATGLPVVSTYHSGIPELIEDGIDGYLVEEKNVPQYVEKIKQALESGESLSSNARAKILDKFNLEKQNRKIIELYDQILG